MSNSRFLLIFLVLLAIQASAQDSLQSAPARRPFLSAGAVSIDYGKLFGQFLDSESKLEAGGQVEFKGRYVVIGEFGHAQLTPNGAYQHTDYQSEGSYFRIGLGYKIDITPKNNLYFSARYARASFSDQGVINITSASGIFADIEDPFDRTGLSAQWYEAVMSSEARLWKGLSAGFHLRLKIMDKYDKQEPLDVYSVPGYGRTFDRSIPALNLYLKYAFERF